MKYVLKFTKTALDDLDKHKKSGDQVIIKKINLLLNELLEHPRIGTGQPEMLKHDLQGIYSRRINKKHRLVYKINDEIITFILLSAHLHYGDK